MVRPGRRTAAIGVFPTVLDNNNNNNNDKGRAK